MACVENAISHVDCEREEGEIVDDLDDLSDISSEEEFLLRQRLQVLENYNNVLERKEAKRYSQGSGQALRPTIHDLSDISGSDLEDSCNIAIHGAVKEKLYYKSHHRQKKRRDTIPYSNSLRSKDSKKKTHSKKRGNKVISESSEESEDEYRTRRRKLANAVVVENKIKQDSTSLQARLRKMLGDQTTTIEPVLNPEIPKNKTEMKPDITTISEPIQTQDENTQESQDAEVSKETMDQSTKMSDIEMCSDDEDRLVGGDDLINQSMHLLNSIDTVDSITQVDKNAVSDSRKASDDELELLRQHALKTKSAKPKITESPILPPETENKNHYLYEDEDSDTAELRLICLKSALLKKAIERKRRQKIQKRLSQSTSLQDELLAEQESIENKVQSDNNTDIESLDMDIGSDGDDKGKDISNSIVMKESAIIEDNNTISHIPLSHLPKEDELDEDEDLLRAKLLTSLSKNLPNLVEENSIKVKEKEKEKEKNEESVVPPKPKVVVEEKKFIIALGESDSEGEHEATKNLKKMHMKLSEQEDFQSKLDLFLKSKRLEVENTELPDVVQQPQELKEETAKPKEKFVAKAVKHLPKSEQIEYKNLVKRMAELEKLKQARQAAMNKNSIMLPAKVTLKPRNTTVNSVLTTNILEERIAISRNKIAKEAARILELKEEATKLTQKYKIVANELKNISTAITLNKNQQKMAQTRLFKIRSQHQMLLQSPTLIHSKKPSVFNDIVLPVNKLQKENNPAKKETNTLKEASKNPHILKTMKFSVTNDLKEESNPTEARLSVQIEVSNNTKTIKIPTSPDKGVKNDVGSEDAKDCDTNNVKDKVMNTINSKELAVDRRLDDYESPLQALCTPTWEDPNGVLCPFEVGGNCKDPDCKYLHPKPTPPVQ